MRATAGPDGFDDEAGGVGFDGGEGMTPSSSARRDETDSE